MQPIELLDSIPGIGRGHAEQLLARLVLAWIFQSNFLQLRIYVPGLEWFQLTMKVLEKKSGKTRKGNKKLQAALVEAHIQQQEQKIPIFHPNTNVYQQ